MNLVKIKLLNTVEFEGIIIGENALGIRLITEKKKLAIITQKMLDYTTIVRKLTDKEELEVQALLDNQKQLSKKEIQIAELKKEVQELNEFASEQENKISCLIFKKQEKQILTLSELSPLLTEEGFRMLKILEDMKQIKISQNGEIQFLEQGNVIDAFGEPTKEELAVLVNSISVALPILDLLKKCIL